MAMGMGSVNGYAAGAGTMLFGLHEYFKGKKDLKNNQRPTYEIPQEIGQNLTEAQQRALQGMPEDQKQQYISNLQRSSAYSLSQANSRKGGLQGLSTINQNQNDAYGNMLSMDSQARMQNQDKLMGARQTMADYRDQKFQVNQMNPYYEKQAAGLALEGAGIQNIGNSFAMGQGGGAQGQSNDGGLGSSGKAPQGNGANTGEMGKSYWDNKMGTNYNPQSSGGSGNYQYQGQQYASNIG